MSKSDVSRAELHWLPHVEPQLRAAAERQAALSESPGAVLVQDCRGEIVAANPAAETLLGLSWRQLVGLTSLDPRWQAVTEDGIPLPGERHPALVALVTGRPVTGFLMGVLIPPEARTVWLDVDAHPLPVLEPGEASRPAPVCGVIVLFTDISGSPRGRRACDNLVQAYRLLADNASDIVLRSDRQGRFEWVSPSIEALTGWRPVELLGRRLLDLVHPDDVGTVMGHLEKVFTGCEDQYTVRMAQENGTFRWMAASVRPHPAGSTSPRSAVFSLRDVHDAISMQAQLAQSEAQYRMLVHNLTDIVVHLRDGVIVWISPSAGDVLALTTARLVGSDFEAIVVQEDRRTVQQAAIDLAGGQATSCRLRMRASDRTVHWFDMRARAFIDERGSRDGAVLTLRDVTDETRERRRLEHLAEHDSATGLLNRFALDRRLSARLEARPRTTPGVALLHVHVHDLDQVRGRHGRREADRFLREIADRIAPHTRQGDLLARIGDNEIVVALEGIQSFADAIEAADRILVCGAAPYRLAGNWTTPSLNIGTCLAIPGEPVDAALLRAAETGFPNPPMP